VITKPAEKTIAEKTNLSLFIISPICYLIVAEAIK